MDDGLSQALAPPAAPITAIPLDAPPADSVGLVDQYSGGFPESLWENTEPEVARALALQLPHRYVNFAACRIAQRFLLSGAQPSKDGDEGATGAFLEARVTALAGIGDWTNALALSELVPAERRTPTMAHTRVDGLLITAKVDAACSEAQRGLTLSESGDDSYWQKVEVLCDAIEGKTAAAGLAIGLLREQGVVDPAFFWAADLLQGNAGPVPKDAKLSALTFAMLRQAATPLPADLVAAGDPSTLIVAAQIAGAGTNDEARLALLERAVASGVVPPEVLRNAYAELSLKGEATDAEKIALDTPRQRAATYQLAVAQSIPTARAEVIARALDLARDSDPTQTQITPATIGLVFSEMVLQMPPSADLAWFAGTAVRVLIAADHAGVVTAPSRLKTWLDLVQGMSATSEESAIVNSRLFPYRQLLAGGPISSDVLQAWAATLKDMPPAQARAQQEFLLGQLTTLGDPVSLDAWQGLLDGGEPLPAPTVAPPLAAWHALTAATVQRRLGEAVALALQLLGRVGINPPSDLAVGRALESLATLQRGADARAISVELALDRGL